MATSSHEKRMLRALRGDVLTPPPLWLMRQAGRYLPEYRELRNREPDFLRFCYTPDLAVEATLQPLRRYPLDAAILFADILVIPDALGQGVRFEEGEGPILDAITDRARIGDLDIGRVEDHLAPVFETISRLAGDIPADAALIGFAGAPWTVAVYMIEGRGGTDHATVKAWASDTASGFDGLTDILVEATSRYLLAQVTHGAEVIQLFDSWAGVLADDEALFERWIVEPTRKIVENVHRHHPGMPVIGFPRGAGRRIEAYVAGTGVNGVSLDQDMPLDVIADVVQPRCTAQGNLDNQVLVRGGAELDRQAGAILDALGSGPFIFNLGHGIVPETPPGNVAQLCGVVRNWRPAAAADGRQA